MRCAKHRSAVDPICYVVLLADSVQLNEQVYLDGPQFLHFVRNLIVAPYFLIKEMFRQLYLYW